MTDIGFNQWLFGYDISKRKPGRVRKQVIRIQRPKDDKPEDHESEDASGAGLDFSPEELDIENRPLEELAIVVGELLPASAVKGYKKFASPHHDNGKNGACADDFDATKHKVVVLKAHEKSQVLVQRLTNTKGYLRVLKRKKNGICEAVKPKLTLTHSERVIYYPEWTVGPRETAHRPRGLAWMRDNVLEFAKQYGTSQESANVNTTSKPIPSSQPDLLPLDPALQRRADVLRLLSWAETDGGDHTNIQQAGRILDSLLGEPPSFQSRTKLGRLARLFNNPEEIEEEEAKEVAKSCQVLASGGYINEGQVLTYQPRHLLALCKALQSDRLRTLGVEERLRLDTVTAFCTILDDAEDNGSAGLVENEGRLAHAARLAHRLAASMSQTGSVSQTSLVLNEPGTDLHQIHVRLQRAPVAFALHVLEKVKEGLTLAIEKDRGGVHGLTVSHQDVPTIIDALATANDHNHAMNAARDIVRCSVLLGQVPVEQAMTLIDEASVTLKDVLDAIDGERGQADEKDEGRMDRDEREGSEEEDSQKEDSETEGSETEGSEIEDGGEEDGGEEDGGEEDGGEEDGEEADGEDVDGPTPNVEESPPPQAEEVDEATKYRRKEEQFDLATNLVDWKGLDAYDYAVEYGRRNQEDKWPMDEDIRNGVTFWKPDYDAARQLCGIRGRKCKGCKRHGDKDFEYCTPSAEYCEMFVRFGEPGAAELVYQPNNYDLGALRELVAERAEVEAAEAAEKAEDDAVLIAASIDDE